MSYFFTIIFYGAIWGITESTLGYLLHLLPISIGFLIWLPLAFFFMNQVYKATGKIRSIIFISLISAAIKLINLLMPTRIDKVINPAVSIILEGCSFALITYFIANKKWIFSKTTSQNVFSSIPAVVLCNTLWRCFYLIYLLFVPKWMFEISVLASSSSLLKFMVTDNLLTCLVMVVCSKVAKKTNLHWSIQKYATPVVASLLMIVNVVETVML